MAVPHLQEISTFERRTEVEVAPQRLPTRLAVMPFASAVANVALAGYLLCTALAALNLNLLVGLFQPWFHGVVLVGSASSPVVFALGPLLVSAVTFGALAWVAAATTAALYNLFARR